MVSEEEIRRVEEGIYIKMRMDVRDAIGEVKHDEFKKAAKLLTKILGEDMMGERLEARFAKKGIEARLEANRRMILKGIEEEKNELSKLIREKKKADEAAIKKDKKKAIELLEMIMYRAGLMVAGEQGSLRNAA